MGKYSFEQIKAMLEKIENEQELKCANKNKRRRISVMLDNNLLDEINRQCRELHYISRNEFIVSALAQFCEE